MRFKLLPFAMVAHLQERTDVQNIDLMNLAGFCRNCLSKWLRAEAEQGVEISDPDARSHLRHATGMERNTRNSSVGRRRYSLIAAAA